MILSPRVELSVIIPAYNEGNYLKKTLEILTSSLDRLKKRLGLRYEVIVVDNGSEDATVSIAKDAGVRVIREEKRNIARVRNCGAGAAHGQFLLFLDADTEVNEGVVAQALELLRSERAVGGGSWVKFDSKGWSPRFTVWLWNWLSLARRWAAGCFLFCSKKAFHRVGGFDESCYIAEELLLSERLKKLADWENQEFKILRQYPVRTSARKFERVPFLKGLRFVADLAVGYKRKIRDPQYADWWYEVRRVSSRGQ